MKITESSTLADLDRALQIHALTRCEVTVHLGGRLTAYVADELRSVGAYGQGNTVAEAIDAALTEWRINTSAADAAAGGLLSKLLVVVALTLSLGACATDDEPEPLPYCSEIGAPDSLLCTAAGVCTWEGEQCCIGPVPGREPAPECRR